MPVKLCRFHAKVLKTRACAGAADWPHPKGTMRNHAMSALMLPAPDRASRLRRCAGHGALATAPLT